MGQVFQAKWWEKNHSGWLIMAKGNWQRQWKRHLGMQIGIFGNLFMKIMEIRRKGR